MIRYHSYVITFTNVISKDMHIHMETMLRHVDYMKLYHKLLQLLHHHIVPNNFFKVDSYLHIYHFYIINFNIGLQQLILK